MPVYTAKLETPYSPEELADACNRHADANFAGCPCGEAAFVCPFAGPNFPRCGEITANDWRKKLKEKEALHV